MNKLRSIITLNRKLLQIDSNHIKILRVYFNYNSWYKIEQERIKRIREKKKKLFEDSYFNLAKYFGKEGLNECKKLLNEFKDAFTEDHKLILEHGDFEYLFKFNSLDDIKKWSVNTDSGYQIGKSKAAINLTQQNTGLFHGYLSNQLDKPEKTNALYTGYANTTSLPIYRSFYRKGYLNLKDFNCFVMRIRGDGRNYMVTLKNSHYFRETETYLFMHPLFTRGGPYWQTVKIPFSKFFHCTHGRVSDRQFRFLDDDVTNIGFTAMDGIEGPFSLELDYIGVLNDEELKENFAYETYRTAKYISNT